MAALGLPTHALAAEEPASGWEDAAAVAAAGSAAATVRQAPVVITRATGTVRLAEVGDDLGERRFEVRDTSAGALVVGFSRTRPRLANTPLSGGDAPSSLPLQNARLTSGFGYRFHPLSGRYQPHAGIDLAAPSGTPVVATANGVVGAAGWMGGYGLTVRLGHAGDTETLYAHLSASAVRAGQTVQRGQIIGYVGSTGRSTGPHLHYEVRVGSVPVDPL